MEYSQLPLLVEFDMCPPAAIQNGPKLSVCMTVWNHPRVELATEHVLQSFATPFSTSFSVLDFISKRKLTSLSKSLMNYRNILP